MKRAHDKPALVFVHGFGSSSDCWKPLIGLLEQDPRIASTYKLETFEYPTRWFSLNPLRRIPELAETADQLGKFLAAPSFDGCELTLIGHSQGGLVIQSHLARRLQRGRGDELRAIRQVILIATPNRGSTLFSPVRKLLLFKNPQDRTLRVLNREIHELMQDMQERVLDADAYGDHQCPIPVHCIYGVEDAVVQEASARGPYPEATPVRGDHFSILQPRDHHDERYERLAEAIVEPIGHPKVHEIALYDSRLRIAPILDPDHQRVPVPIGRPEGSDTLRIVESDNRAQITKTVRFARSNQCQDPYVLRYATRANGALDFTTSHENQWSPGEQRRFLDTAAEVTFRFTPRSKPGTVYSLDLDIYKGFDEGHRNTHLHLGTQRHFHRIRHELDLTAYLDAGYRVVEPPRLHFNPHDAGHDQRCGRKNLGQLVQAVAERNGVWSWTLDDIWEGVIDIRWEETLEPPSPRAEDA